jgi:hypothetical protein
MRSRFRWHVLVVSFCYSAIYLLHIYKDPLLLCPASTLCRQQSVFDSSLLLSNCLQILPHISLPIPCPCSRSRTPQEYGSSTFVGHCTVNVEFGIQWDAALISGSVSEIVSCSVIPLASSFLTTGTADDSTPGTEVSFSPSLSGRILMKLLVAPQCQVLALCCTQIKCALCVSRHNSLAILSNSYSGHSALRIFGHA